MSWGDRTHTGSLYETRIRREGFALFYMVSFRFRNHFVFPAMESYLRPYEFNQSGVVMFVWKWIFGYVRLLLGNGIIALAENSFNFLLFLVRLPYEKVNPLKWEKDSWELKILLSIILEKIYSKIVFGYHQTGYKRGGNYVKIIWSSMFGSFFLRLVQKSY